MFRLSSYLVASFLALTFIAKVETAHAADPMKKYNGMWSAGFYLDGTDCDTERERILREEFEGIVQFFSVKKVVNRRPTTISIARGLSRNWYATKVTRKKFTGVHQATISGALVRETLTVSEVRNGEGYATLKGRIARGGYICTYEYSGSIAR